MKIYFQKKVIQFSVVLESEMLVLLRATNNI